MSLEMGTLHPHAILLPLTILQVRPFYVKLNIQDLFTQSVVQKADFKIGVLSAPRLDTLVPGPDLDPLTKYCSSVNHGGDPHPIISKG